MVLRLVNGVTVSPDGHYSIDYYDLSASNRSQSLSRLLPCGRLRLDSGVAHIAIYPPTQVPFRSC